MTEQDDFPDERPQRRREYTGSGSTLGVAVLVVVAVGFAIWWFEFRSSNPSGSGEPGLGIVALAPDLNPTSQPPAGEEGRAAPNFTLRTPSGGRSTLTDYRGGYVLLNFWASWCPPCRTEAPELQRFAENHAGAITVLGVNIQESPGEIAGFVEDFSLSYPMVIDGDGQVTNAYRMPSPPISVLVGPDGVIVRYYFGAVGAEDLDAIAAEYLG